MDKIFQNYLSRNPYNYEYEIYKNIDDRQIISDILKTQEYFDLLNYKIDLDYYYSNNYLGFKNNIAEIKNSLKYMNEVMHKKYTDLVDRENTYNNVSKYIEKEYTNYLQNIKNRNNMKTIDIHINIIRFIKKIIVTILLNINDNNPNIHIFDTLESLYTKLRFIYDSSKYSIAVSLHIGNCDIFDDIMIYLHRLKDTIIFDLYANILVYGDYRDKNHTIIKNKLLHFKSDTYISTYENIGMDIGPFLKHIKYIKEIKKTYDFVLKLHTKTNVVWRNELIDPLLSSSKNILYYLNRMQNDKNIGMICSNKWLLNMDTLNNYILFNLLKKYKIAYNSECKFVGGTIFWIKWDILSSFFTVNKIDELYSMLEKGYSENKRPTVVHSIERLFGIIIVNYKNTYLAF